MRRFIRHPTDIPIYISLNVAEISNCTACAMKDVSLGGMACEVDEPMSTGALVKVSIPSVRPRYDGIGEVVWCRSTGDRYEIGVQFISTEEAYKSRMVQQVCQIEHYKNMVFEREGRLLDSDQAALEWIEKYAAEFPQ